ncbi:MAG TPA: hypothetical protein DCL44_04060 [Elusimicrobia bacterium]|nr:hypothetical protein [Elusimicrobiota bacterium]
MFTFLLLGAGTLGMTTVMTKQLTSMVPQITQMYKTSLDKRLASFDSLEGLARPARESIADDEPANDDEQAALQKMIAEVGAGGGLGGLSAKAGGMGFLSQNMESMEQAWKFFKKNKNSVLPVTWWGLPLILMILTLFSVVFCWYAVARFLCGLTFKFCTLTLTLLSLAIIVSAIAGKPEFIGAIPRDLWFAPVIFITGSAVVIRIIDMNYPVWNEALKAFAFPILTSVGVIGWTYFKGIHI